MHVPWMNKMEESSAWTIIKLYYYLLNHIFDEINKRKYILYFMYIYMHSPATLLGTSVQLLGNTKTTPVPLLSAKNRKRRIQFTQAHQNWTIEDWKNIIWSDEFRFLLRHSDVGSEFGVKGHESMDPSCLVSTVQAAGGVMLWGILSWHTLGPLVPIEHRLYTTVYLSIVADHVHPFMITVYPSSDATSSRIMHHVSNHLRLVSWTWQWVHFTQMASTVTRSQSNRAALGCGGTRDSHHGCAADKSAATAWCYHDNMFPIPFWIYATKN